MKDAVLLELATRWERDAQEPRCQDGSADAALRNATEHGIRQGKRECADALKTLVQLLGGESPESQLVGYKAGELVNRKTGV